MNEQEYQAKPRNVVVPAVFLIMEDGTGKVLMGLRQGTGYMDGKWDLPSGHIEDGELPTEAMAREAKEEIGIIVFPKHLKLVHTSYRVRHDSTGNRADYVFIPKAYKGFPEVCEPDKCARVEYIQARRIIDGKIPVVPHTRKFVEYYFSGVPHSEFGMNWLKARKLWKL